MKKKKNVKHQLSAKYCPQIAAEISTIGFTDTKYMPTGTEIPPTGAQTPSGSPKNPPITLARHYHEFPVGSRTIAPRKRRKRPKTPPKLRSEPSPEPPRAPQNPANAHSWGPKVGKYLADRSEIFFGGQKTSHDPFCDPTGSSL